jgi:hypothetical protein
MGMIQKNRMNHHKRGHESMRLTLKKQYLEMKYKKKTWKKRRFVWSHLENVECENGSVVICNYYDKIFDKKKYNHLPY